MLGDRVNVYPVKGYSITIDLDTPQSRNATPYVSLLDEAAKIVTSRLGADRLRVAGTAEFNGFNRDIRADRIQPLTDWVRHNFPDIDTSKVVPWAGLRPMMPDMMPVVRAGQRPGVFYNTGHGHLGWTLSAATAQIIAQVVDGWRSPEVPFSPHRQVWPTKIIIPASRPSTARDRIAPCLAISFAACLHPSPSWG